MPGRLHSMARCGRPAGFGQNRQANGNCGTLRKQADVDLFCRGLTSCTSRNRAKFVPTPIWHDLEPVEWLIRKMGQNLHMPPATWLVSRELTQAAGPWDTRLSFDDDGEYFCRAVVRSDGIRFVPEAKIFYRVLGSGSLSDFDESEKKLASLFLSMELHVGYLCSLENSARVRSACLSYLQRRFFRFYPEQMAFVQQLQQLAATLGGRLEAPQLSWKYAWLRDLFGWKLTKRFRLFYNRSKSVGMRAWDKAVSSLEAKDELGTTSHFRANSAASEQSGSGSAKDESLTRLAAVKANFS